VPAQGGWIGVLEALTERTEEAVVEFTRRSVVDALGRDDVSVFPTSLRPCRVPTGLEALTVWLRAQLAEHGDSDVITSTARALRRPARAGLDQLRVELTLSRRSGDANIAILAELSQILDRATVMAAAATDRVHGEARRLRGRLDAEHARQVADARTVVAEVLGVELPPGPGRPEDRARELREQISAQVRARVETWFAGIGVDLDAALRAVGEETLSNLRIDLNQARTAAEQLLSLPLSSPDESPSPQPPRLPILDFPRDVVWRELVTSTVADHLPSSMRSRRLHRQLRSWAPTSVGRPFGRVRSSLQTWLTDSTRGVELGLTDIWEAQLAALRPAVVEAQQYRNRTQTEIAQHGELLSRRIGVVLNAVRSLDALIDGNAPRSVPDASAERRPPP
jgi:hypothetical protein